MKGSLICALTWLFSVTLCWCKCCEWDRCRDQGDESNRHDIKAHATQLQAERLRRTNGPQAFDRRGGRMSKKGREAAFTFVLGSVRGLNTCVGVLNWGCWIKCVVVCERESTYVVFVGKCVFVFLSVISQPFLCLSLSFYLWRCTALCCPPKLFYILTSQSTSAWISTTY